MGAEKVLYSVKTVFSVFPRRARRIRGKGEHCQSNIACLQQKTGMHMVTETTQVFHTSPGGSVDLGLSISYDRLMLG